ncbi:LPXTG cell wall anchor domain-containing protein [Streptococcus agalactiae]|uniref:LPXTG cell wall anchor domain-containing protein n=1 Tax=Streptococcus agalactiae TaxID=1311 RepID=UPI0021D5CEBB|nr:LPXTG cell wall anchor domain-containing protein [Streptococcus agalactiae]MCU7657264.1 LPXTG cell wall anchor domain-containing protein [Streptococcus agalactiae]MCU7679527.1 LPXTG cell wall anchor domain-containing protein [Streptococcus agalactiae]MCU7682180.1 LPXTG cell wall anchor domain-containing protein [Streptococcus agalactiae]
MKKSLLISSIAIATILLGGTTVSADVTAGTTQPGTGVVTPGTDTSTPTPGTDTSTPTPGTDTSTPTPGTDTSTPTPGTDTSTPTPGTDTNTPNPGTIPGTDSNTPNPGTTPGTSSNTPTSPIMTPTPEAPVDLGNNKVITGITNGVATLSDGSSKTLTKLGAKENGDNTYTVKTKDNKLVTLPHTGDSKNTIFKILGLLSAFASMVLAFKSKKELK